MLDVHYLQVPVHRHTFDEDEDVKCVLPRQKLEELVAGAMGVVPWEKLVVFVVKLVALPVT